MNLFLYLSDEEISKRYGTPLSLIADGASPQAKRYIVLGFLNENIHERTEILKPKPGRPSLPDPYNSMDAIRAMTCWDMAHSIGAAVARGRGEEEYSRQKGVQISNREVIRWVEMVENSPVVSQSTLESSLSRGKKILEIDDRWRSEVCDKLIERFAETT